jgi:hypothetical protein
MYENRLARKGLYEKLQTHRVQEAWAGVRRHCCDRMRPVLEGAETVRYEIHRRFQADGRRVGDHSGFGRGENEEPLVSVSRAAVHPAMSAEEERERQEKAALAISNLLDDLTRLVDNAEIRMENLGEAGVNLTNIDEGENQMRLNTWRYWAEEWIKEVDAFKGGILDKKVYITPKQSKALSTAKLAIRRMKLVPNIGPGVSLKPGEEGYTDHYLPSEHVRKGWLGEIRKLIERSRTQLEKAV